jgi:hypothetical protein
MSRSVVAVALFSGIVLSATPAFAQGLNLWVGGAAAVPMSDSKDVMKTGWLGNVGLGIPIKAVRGLGIGVDGFWGKADSKIVDNSITMYMVTGSLGYTLMPEAAIKPYVFVGGGVLGTKLEGTDSQSDGSFQVGGGLSLKLTEKIELWGDVRYTTAGSGSTRTTLLPIAIGLSCPIGGGGM